jgi:hypothetical protein
MKRIGITAAAGIAALGITLAACGGNSAQVTPAAQSGSATHAPKPKPTVYRFSGSGEWNSPEFKVGSKMTVTYSYANNTSGDGGDNFAADIENNNDDQQIADDIAVSGGKTTTLYPDLSFGNPDIYHLSVDATGSWSFTITTNAGGVPGKSISAGGSGQSSRSQQSAPPPPAAVGPYANVSTLEQSVGADQTQALADAPASEFDYTGPGVATASVSCAPEGSDTFSCSASDDVGDSGSGDVVTVSGSGSSWSDSGMTWTGPYVTAGSFTTPPHHNATAPAPAPSASGNCSPTTSSGHCYKAYEFCPHSDLGMEGTAANGEPIVCKNDDGLRWVPQ